MHYVIIGNCAAGIFAAEAIREIDRAGELTIISNETYPAYARCLTSYYLSGNYPEEKTFLRSSDFYHKNRINLKLGKTVTQVNPRKKTVELADGNVISYDKLLIATGSRPIFPKIEGQELKGVFGLRTLDDAKAILKHLGPRKEAVVIGGGFVALKAAYALNKANINVTLVISSAQVLSQMLDQEAARIIAENLINLGIKIIYQNDVIKINSSLNEQGEEAVNRVELKDNVIIPADVVIIGKGVTPNIELVKNTGVLTDFGILVNEQLQTNVEDIFAAGDVAQANDILSSEKKTNAIWPNATEQGRIAGYNMAGKKLAYEGSVSMNSIDFAGLACIAAGISRAKSIDGYEVLRERKDTTYQKLVFQDGYLVGYILIGDIKRSGILTWLIKERVAIRGYQQLLLEGNLIPKVLW